MFPLIICPPVFRTFDKDNDSFVSMKEWIEGLSVFLRGTLDEKIKCTLFFLSLDTTTHQNQFQVVIRVITLPSLHGSDCFHVYDLNGDNYISREEMFHMLKNSLIRQPTEEDPDEGIKDLVEITLKKMVRGWMLLADWFKYTLIYFCICSLHHLLKLQIVVFQRATLLTTTLFIFVGP